MPADLDTRARAAAAALLRAATDRDVPALPAPRRRSASAARWFAVAVAGVVVMAAAAVAVTRSGGDPTQPATSVAAGTPILILGEIPDGLEPTGAVELPLVGAARGPEQLTVMLFGQPDAADPIASAELAVTVLRSEAVVPAGVGRQVTARGRPAWVSTDGAGRLALSWEEAPNVLALVTSGSLSEADLVAIADGLTFGPDHAEIDVPELPPGLALVGTMTDAGLTGAAAPAVVPDATTGHLVGYQDPRDGRAVVVATTEMSPGEAAVLHWMLGRPLGPVDVRGRPGRLSSQDAGTPDGSAMRAILWEETAGVYVTVAGTVDEAGLLAIAESLRPATEQEWAELEALGAGVSGS